MMDLQAYLQTVFMCKILNLSSLLLVNLHFPWKILGKLHFKPASLEGVTNQTL